MPRRRAVRVNNFLPPCSDCCSLVTPLLQPHLAEALEDRKSCSVYSTRRP